MMKCPHCHSKHFRLLADDQFTPFGDKIRWKCENCGHSIDNSSKIGKLEILKLPLAELQQRVHDELKANPALEAAGDESGPVIDSHDSLVDDSEDDPPLD